MTRRRPGIAHVAFGFVWIAAIAALLALGTWQVQRRAWKLGLIARVEAGLRAPPTAPPATAGKADTYRRISVSGRFMAGRDTFVQASTTRGPGWWVLTPLRTDTGGALFINRGYVPQRRAPPVTTEAVRITGLLRLSEPGGGFLRSNDPPGDRWYSRDIARIAKRRGIANAAPYFIDADAARGGRPGDPVGGLTVIRFPNNHLVYAITWYMLAAMTTAGFLYWVRLARLPIGARG